MGIKMFADGSIGSRTAWMTEEYSDGGVGGQYTDRDTLIETSGRAADLGLQVMTHALGDAAVAAVVDVYREVAASHDLVRPRIEHLELVPGPEWKAMEELGVVASMQPNFTVNWGMPGGMYEDAIGDRYLNTNLYARAMDLQLALGSDCMPMGPMFGIRGATEHPNPQARLTFDQAISAYTEGGAYASMMEDSAGRLEPGSAGDLVVLNGTSGTAEVLMTVIDGVVVYSAVGPGSRPM
jgi:predicted amidohydrolase YtcJ